MSYTILCDQGVPFTASELLSPAFVQAGEQEFASVMERIDGDIYVIAMSPAFSGSYAAACQAREAVLARQPDKTIFVIDTRTAFAGELAVARRLHDFLLRGMAPEQALLETQNFIENLSTMGVLGRADVLREKGAVRRFGAMLRARLCRMLLMEGGQDGKLHIRGRGTSGEALFLLAKKRFSERKEKPLRCVITYAGCPQKARELGKRLKAACGFRELVIIPADQLATRFMGSGTMMAAF